MTAARPSSMLCRMKPFRHTGSRFAAAPLSSAYAVSLVAVCLTIMSCGAPGSSSRKLPTDAPAHVREAVDQCLETRRPDKTDCYEPLVLARLAQHGVSDAMSMLETIAMADEGVERDGHVYTHMIGIEAFRANPNLSEVFPQCSTLFQSGCYHGVIQAHFMAKGSVEATDVRQLCAAYGGEGGDRWTLFQCLHGLGHGLTMFYGHSLPRALEGCDHLQAWWDRQSCYGGAFMENVLNATAPHHPASELAAEEGGHAAGEHHDESVAATEPADSVRYMTPSGWRAMDPEDPLYPCSAMESRYLPQCYVMQTSVMLHLNGGDIRGAAGSCELAPEDMRAKCFQSLGRDISSYTLQDVDDSIRLCRHSPEEYRAWCYVGLVKNFIDLTSETEKAFTFCRKIEGQVNKLRCYVAIGEQLASLLPERLPRVELCRRAESAQYEQACLYGARVARQRPDGI